MNMALWSSEKKHSERIFMSECLTRHYQNMGRHRALLLHGRLETKKEKLEFKRKLNNAKGEYFI